MSALRFISALVASAVAFSAASGLAETPIAITYVRVIKVDGWSLLCLGGPEDVGHCSAKRELGKATVEIEFGRSNVAVKTSGSCVGTDKVERTELVSANNSKIGLADAIHKTALSSIRSLPKQCKVPNLPNFETSIQHLGAVLVDLDN